MSLLRQASELIHDAQYGERYDKDTNFYILISTPDYHAIRKEMYESHCMSPFGDGRLKIRGVEIVQNQFGIDGQFILTKQIK